QLRLRRVRRRRQWWSVAEQRVGGGRDRRTASGRLHADDVLQPGVRSRPGGAAGSGRGGRAGRPRARAGRRRLLSRPLTSQHMTSRTAAETARAVRAGELTARRAVEEALARIEELDGRLQAFQEVRTFKALR